MCSSPKIPKPRAIAPPTLPPELTVSKEARPSGQRAAQRTAAVAGTSQLRIPIKSVGVRS